MANFDKAIADVFKFEGGYIDDMRDTGGATNYGISRRVYPDLDIVTLTISQAKKIYYDDWWVHFRFPEIKSDAVASQLFHVHVNIGAKNSARLMQRAIRAVCNEIVEDDGVMGSKTIAAINRNSERLIQEFGLLCAHKSEVANYYRNLKNDTFLTGWLNRIYTNTHFGDCDD